MSQERRKRDYLLPLLMLFLSTVLGYAVWQNNTMYSDIKADVKDIKVAIVGHVKEQAICEKNTDGRIVKLETLVCGRAYAEPKKDNSIIYKGDMPEWAEGKDGK